MSKIRQALGYERRLTDAQIAGHVALREEAFGYERKLTDAQFHELKSLQDSHVEFHEREHLLYEDAIEKASSAIQGRLDALQAEVERLADASTNFMSTGRFEREHAQLLERVDAAFARVDEKLGAEEKVTITQTTRDAMLEQLTVTRRWQAGIAVTVVIALVVTILNWLKVI